MNNENKTADGVFTRCFVAALRTELGHGLYSDAAADTGEQRGIERADKHLGIAGVNRQVTFDAVRTLAGTEKGGPGQLAVKAHRRKEN